MNILIFILVLSVLVFVHELGHFLFAKWNNIRIDSFAIGFKPTLWSKKVGETTYKINAIPFGGYVSIHGQSADEESLYGSDSHRSMINKPAWAQALVLFGGILFNIIFAWILISASFMIGVPAAFDEGKAQYFGDVALTVVAVVPESPADSAGIKPGDRINHIVSNDVELAGNIDPNQLIALIASGQDRPLTFDFTRGGEDMSVAVTPELGLVPDLYAIGISMEQTGIVQLPIAKALWSGAKQTWSMTYHTAGAFVHLIGGLFTGNGEAKNLTGPVGLVGIVGDAATIGFTYLMMFTALISVNLAILNLIPFPALDGGRLLFLLIEKIKGSRIKSEVADVVNTIGFFILIGLMIAVTVGDVIRLL